MLKKELDKLSRAVSDSPDLPDERRRSLTRLIGEVREQSAPPETLIGKLEQEVSMFETRRPDLAEMLNRICVMLADIGI